MDRDKVDLSNLHRQVGKGRGGIKRKEVKRESGGGMGCGWGGQIIHREGTVGHHKATSAAAASRLYALFSQYFKSPSL